MKNKMRWLGLGMCVLFVSTVMSVPIDHEEKMGKEILGVDIDTEPIQTTSIENTSFITADVSVGEGLIFDDIVEGNESQHLIVIIKAWWNNSNDPICIWLISELPEGAEYDYSGKCANGLVITYLNWTPNYCQAGTYYIDFKYGYGEVIEYFTLTIIIHNINRKPTLTLNPSGPITVKAGETIHIDVHGEDEDKNQCGDDSLDYYCSDDEHFHEPIYGDPYFEWTTTLDDVGDHTVTIGVTDEHGAGEEEEVPIKVEEAGLTIESVFQPEQVVWQDAPTPPTENENRLKEIDPGKHYEAEIPMIKGKNTLLFGYSYNNRFKITVSITNKYDYDREIKLQFSIQPDNKVVYLYPNVITVKKGETKTEPINVPKGIPDTPFQWGNSGKGSVELEALPADSKPLNSNKVITEVEIVDTNPLSIIYFPIKTKVTDWAYLNFNAYVEFTENANEFIQGTYPLAENEFAGYNPLSLFGRNPQVVENWLNEHLKDLNFPLDAPSNEQEFLNKNNLQKIYKDIGKFTAKLNFKRGVALVPSDFFEKYGANAPNYSRSVGLAWPRIAPAAVLVEVPDYPSAAAHEIAHTFGLNLATWNAALRKWESGEEYDVHPEYRAYGYWVNKGEDRDKKTCFMNYANTLSNTWVCTVTYTELIQALQRPDPASLFLSGTAYKNNTIILDEVFWIPQGYVDVVEGEGDYSVVLVKNGIVIAKYNFTLAFHSPLGGESLCTVDSVPFAFRVPWINGTEVIQIQSAEKEILTEIGVSSNTPQVTVIYPNGGEEILLGNCTITWDVYDADGDDLTYDVMISMDEGENWIPIGMELTENSYTCNLSIFPSGSSYLMKVSACDGVNTGQDTSDTTFTILPDSESPTVKIIKPLKGLYINDREILPLPFTVVIGSITVETEASDNVGIANVSFYVDDELKNICCTSPYCWLCDEPSFFAHRLKVEARDFAGNPAIDERWVWIFNW